MISGLDSSLGQGHWVTFLSKTRYCTCVWNGYLRIKCWGRGQPCGELASHPGWGWEIRGILFLASNCWWASGRGFRFPCSFSYFFILIYQTQTLDKALVFLINRRKKCVLTSTSLVSRHNQDQQQQQYFITWQLILNLLALQVAVLIEAGQDNQ